MKCCCYCVFFICLLLSGQLCAQNLDVQMLRTINPRHPDAEVWRINSGSLQYVAGSIGIGTLAYGLISGNQTIKQNGYELLITMGINCGTTFLLKSTVRRTRPYEKYPNDVFALSVSGDKSFPSGHTSQAFATATTLALQYRKWWVAVPAFAWAGSVGYSRMYLGKHYPTDVLAGALIGAGSSFAGHFITNKLFHRKKMGHP